MKTNTQIGQRLLSWEEVKMTLEKESRFYNDIVARQLDYVFGAGEDSEMIYNDPVISHVGSYDSRFSMYRARYFGTPDSLISAMVAPDMELVRPPSKFAKAGRINAEGISVLYGANGKKVALSEVRPPIGSHAVIFRINVIDGIRLLDIEKLKNTLNEIFGDASDEYSRGNFVSKFENQISKPIMPEDESTEYVVTQVISDYLSKMENPNIDGLIYKSAQKKEEGKNIVLFHNSSAFRPFDESDIDRLFGKIKEDYSHILQGMNLQEIRDLYVEKGDNGGSDGSSAKVELDIESISVYEVLSADFRTDPPIDEAI